MTRRLPTIGLATPAESNRHQTKTAAESYVHSSTKYPSTTTFIRTQPKRPEKKIGRTERFVNHGMMPRKDCLKAAKKKAQELKEQNGMKEKQAKAQHTQATLAERKEDTSTPERIYPDKLDLYDKYMACLVVLLLALIAYL